MKTCLCCGALVDDSAKTCPACGEATWITGAPIRAAYSVDVKPDAREPEKATEPDPKPVVETKLQPQRQTGWTKGHHGQRRR